MSLGYQKAKPVCGAAHVTDMSNLRISSLIRTQGCVQVSSKLSQETQVTFDLYFGCLSPLRERNTDHICVNKTLQARFVGNNQNPLESGASNTV